MRPDSTVYQGARGTRGPVVICDKGPLTPAASQKVRNHSPDGFEWGYSGSGPAQLALALLLDFLQDEGEARHRYMEFKFLVVSGWREDSWKITGEEIRRWVEIQRHARPYTSEPDPEPDDMLSMADVADGEA